MPDYTISIDLETDRDEVDVLTMLELAVKLIRGEPDVEITGASMNVFRDHGDHVHLTPVVVDTARGE